MTEQKEQRPAFFLKPKQGQYGEYFFGNVDGYAVSVSKTREGSLKLSSGEQFFIAAPKTNQYGEFYSFIFNKRFYFGNFGKGQWGPYLRLVQGNEADVADDDAALNAPAKKYEKPAPRGPFSANAGSGRGAPKGAETGGQLGEATGASKAQADLPKPNRYTKATSNNKTLT